MSNKEIVLNKVKEFLNTTLQELIAAQGTLIVLRSSEKNIAESYGGLGADTLEMIELRFISSISKFKRLVKKLSDFSVLQQFAKEINLIFETDGYSVIRLLELYIIYTQVDLIKLDLSYTKDYTIDDLKIVRSNGAVAKKILDHILDIFLETGHRVENLIPKELKLKAA